MSRSEVTLVGVRVTIIRVEKLPSHAISPNSVVRIKWERGTDKDKQGSFPEVRYQRGVGEWLDSDTATASLTCTMIHKSSNSYKSKKMTFRIESYDPTKPKTKKTLGKAVLNLSEHISPPGKANTTCMIPIQNKYNTGTLTVDIQASTANNGPSKANAGSIGSDDLATDLDDVDDDFIDRIVPGSVAIDSGKLLEEIKSPREASKVLTTNTKKTKLLLNEIKKLEQEIETIKHSADQQYVATSPRGAESEVSKILQEIRQLESKDAENTTKLQNQCIEMEMHGLGDNSTMKKASALKVEVMMSQLLIEDLKQDQEYQNYILEDYRRTLDALKPKKGGNVNAVGVFEQQLRFMKQDNVRYNNQYEEYKDYIQELIEDQETFEERIAVASAPNFDVPPQFREREFFLRKEFLCEAGKYDSITSEPTAALKAVSYLHKNDCEQEWIMEILLMTRFMAINAKGDLEMICYWFAVSLCLTNHLQSSKKYKFLGDIQASGVSDDSAFCDDAEGPNVQQTLSLLNYELYLLICKQIFPEIDDLVEVSFFSSMALIIDASKTLIDPSRSVEGLIQLLSRLTRRMKEAEIYPRVTKQIFHQLIYYISTTLANRLLTTPELCTPTVALSIKMGLSFVEGWIQETSASDEIFVEHCQDHLVYILDVVGILMTAAYQEDLFVTEESIQEKFRSLSILQVHQLVTSYSPDKYIPENVSDGALQAIKRLYNSLSPTEKSKENLCFSTTLPLANIQAVDFDIDESDDPDFEYSE